MKKISLYLYNGLVLLLTANLLYAQTEKPVIRFGLIADPQYADADSRGTRFYRNSLKKLEDCVITFNQEKLPFMINLGDITDRNPADLDPVLQVLKQLRSPVYTTPGNHDYTGVASNETLYKKLKMPAPYYSFKKGNWRFIMLNTNEIASYSNVAGTWKEQELNVMLKNINERHGKNAQEYNGGISSRQLQWLKALLQRSERKGENVLIFSHHPFGCATGLTALNDKEVIAVIAPFKCVRALIAGHHHAGAFCEIGTLPCIVAEGMVETPDQNSYGIVELYPDKLMLKGYGRMTTRTISFKTIKNR
ncbi:metallophosphoesterase [Niabella drilacis]|nr:metallophosphoesterase [Niabella drilacis]